jgi:curved DNA-binding protein CbpA
MNRSSDFLDTLADRTRKQDSGILTVVRGKQRRLFCLRDGRVIFVASNVLEEQLTAQLIEDGTLQESAVESLLADARKKKMQAVRLLRESGLWEDSTLCAAMARWIIRMSIDTLSWKDPDASWRRGTPDLKDEITVPVDPIDLLRAVSTDTSISISRIRGRLSPLNRRFSWTEASKQGGKTGPLDPAERYLLSVADGTLSAEQAVRQSGLNEESAWRALHTLVLAGWVEFKQIARERGSTELDTFVVPRTEVDLDDWLLQTASDNHYEVLQLESHATRDQIRSRYYAIAREMHPDRFRAAGMETLVDRVEICFGRITEAYNTLDDAERRTEYDRELAEMSSKSEHAPDDSASVAEQNHSHGKALMDRKRYQDALPFLKNAVEMSPTNRVYVSDYAETLIRNPRARAEAEKQLLRLLELDPTNARPLLLLGRLYQRSGHAEQAASVLQEALRWDPNFTEASMTLNELGTIDAPRFSREGHRPVYN